MRTLILIWFFMIWTTNSFGQDCAEYEKHLKSIDSTFFPGHIIDRADSVFNANKAFVDYTINHLLDKPSDKCFISNRTLLRKFKIISCDSSEAIIIDTLKNGKSCKISFITGKFDPKNHQIVANEDFSSISKIDNQYPFGGQYGIPKIEIEQIQIEIEGLNIKIPNEAYSNLYYPLMCENDGFSRQVEVYESLNGEYIYLYIYGGNAAGTYFAKLIFDHSNYITKIVSDYYPLSIYSSFRESFVGF